MNENAVDEIVVFLRTFLISSFSVSIDFNVAPHIIELQSFSCNTSRSAFVLMVADTQAKLLLPINEKEEDEKKKRSTSIAGFLGWTGIDWSK
jgi:hypothetical protein